MRKAIVLGAVCFLCRFRFCSHPVQEQRGRHATTTPTRSRSRRTAAPTPPGRLRRPMATADVFLLEYGPDAPRVGAHLRNAATSPSGFDSEFAAGLAVAADDPFTSRPAGTACSSSRSSVPPVTCRGTPLTGRTAPSSGRRDRAGMHIYVSGLVVRSRSRRQRHRSPLLKFDPKGNVVWARAWGGAGFNASRAVAVGTDGAYLAGETNSFFANDAFLVKFDFDGNARVAT